MRRFLSISLLSLALLCGTGCGVTGVTTKASDESPFGVVPQLTFEGEKNDELEAVNVVLEEVTENAPSNPLDWMAWVGALGAAAAAGGGFYLKRKFGGKK